MRVNGHTILYLSAAVGGGVLGFYLGGKLVMRAYFQEAEKKKRSRLDKSAGK